MSKALAIASRDSKPEVIEVAGTEPAAGQVAVAVCAATVNGFDLSVAAGYVFEMLPHTFPVVLGRDFAGVITAVGDGVDGLSVGDRVAGVNTSLTLGATGTIAEAVVIDAEAVAKIPDGLGFEQAAALGLAGVMALDVVNAAGIGADDTVLVSGATGGVGAYAVQLAAQKGATVIATARPSTVDFVRGLGAASAVDFQKDLSAQVREAAPDGLSVVIHAAGDPAELAKYLAPGGRLVSTVNATAEAVGRADITVTPAMAVATRENLTYLLNAAAGGTLVVPIAGTYPLHDAAQALAQFGSAGKTGKLLITIP
jgi:NADPH:quinone reductase-like Zn-dependent oxidoreductase